MRIPSQDLYNRFFCQRSLCMTSFALSLLVAGACAYLLYRGDVAHFKTKSFCIPGCVAGGVSLALLVASVLLYRQGRANLNKAMQIGSDSQNTDEEEATEIQLGSLDTLWRFLHEREHLGEASMEALVTFYQTSPFDMNWLHQNLRAPFLTLCAQKLVQDLPDSSFENQREIIAIIFAYPAIEPLATLTQAPTDFLEPYQQQLVNRIKKRNDFHIGTIRNPTIRETIRAALN